MVQFFLLIIAIVYALIVLLNAFSWHRNPNFKKGFSGKVSVVVALKDESAVIDRLMGCLLQQNYSDYEIVLVNDHSTDDTLQQLKAYQVPDANIQVLDLVEGEGKKAALAKGIAQASGQVILCTDADCTMNADWLDLMVRPFVSAQVEMVMGPVMLQGDGRWFARFQQMEFSSLMGFTGGMSGWRKPIFCNGANLAYRKSMFDFVKGFEGIDQIPTGDDELLMRKCLKFSENSVVFQKNAQAVVLADVMPRWSAFVAQRLRWSSKWNVGKSWLEAIPPVAVFSLHALTLLFLVLGLIWPSFGETALMVLMVRFVSEGMLLVGVHYQTKRPWDMLSFVVMFILYPFYAVYFGLLSWRSSYEWKGRVYQK